jgi:nicotinate-nucleotide adenylyltransferase
MNKRQIGIFGGAFNPLHLGHVMVCAYALATEELDEIVVVPCNDHPFQKDMLPFYDRYEMCHKVLRGIYGDKITVSGIERHIEIPNYTYRTLQELQKIYYPENYSMRLILGTDTCRDFCQGKWKKPEIIEELASPFIVVPRDGVILPDISSTEIRNALARGRNVEKCFRNKLPKEVIEYYLKKGREKNESLC